MFQTGLITLNQVIQLLIFIGAGYFLYHTGRFQKDAAHTLSLLLTYIFAPSYIVAHLMQELTFDILRSKFSLMGLAVITQLLLIVVGMILSRILSKNDRERRALLYGYTFANTGYFGFPLIEGVFGTNMLTDFMLFNVPGQVFIYTYGYQIFDKESNGFMKRLVNPFFAATVIGIGLGLSGLQIPQVIADSLSGAGACMSPVAMLLVGFELGRVSFKELFSDIRCYGLALVRLLGIPLIVIGVLFFCGLSGNQIIMPLIISSMPYGMNMVVFPENFGEAEAAECNAKLCVASYLTSVITLPWIVMIVKYLGA